jgi:hypothetical protein
MVQRKGDHMLAPLFYPYYLGLKWMGLMADASKNEPPQPAATPPVANTTHAATVRARPIAARGAPSPTKTQSKRGKKTSKQKKR